MSRQPPPDFESRAAFGRIVKGLVALDILGERAEWAARVALDEAPFAAPTPDSWALVCSRARQLAGSDWPTGKPLPFVEVEG